VGFYNDSIASSPARTIAGLKSFDKKVILIAGGYDKQLSYKPLADELVSHVKALVLLGQTKEKIRAEVDRLDPPVEFPVYETCSLEEAVKAAYMAAQAGDIILFSPASASFDMFKNFEQRGNAFKTIANSLVQ
jgi:UDP-N-acetylmuramoylalanine--D-glutamate ligase